MVSITPTKRNTSAPSFKHRCSSSGGKRRSSSQLKHNATTLYRSSKPCFRRLLAAFSRLTTSKRQRRGRFRLLNALQVQDSHPLLFDDRSKNSDNKPTAFLDLDETLVHSTPHLPTHPYDFVVHPTISGHSLTFYVLKRPGVDQLLSEIAKTFEIVVFTAGLREYASLVIDQLDPTGDLISHRLYRDSCKSVDGKMVKDLASAGRDLDKVVIVDDNPNSYSLQPENAVPILPFVDDLGDCELHKLSRFFQVAEMFADTRDAVKYYLSQNAEEEKFSPVDVTDGGDAEVNIPNCLDSSLSTRSGCGFALKKRQNIFESLVFDCKSNV